MTPGRYNRPGYGVRVSRGRRRLLLAAVVAAAVLGTCAAAASGGVVRGYPHSYRCGTFKLSDGGYVTLFRVTVLKGSVKCLTARHVLRDFESGRGTLHGPPSGPISEQSWTLDGGWSCGRGAGGGACIRGGSNYKVARQFIEADAVP